MTPIAIGLLAFTMSIDAFVAAIGRGASNERRDMRTALKTGAVFGVVEMITPLIGWSLGMAASTYIRIFDHWIAFFLLTAVGLHIIFHAYSGDGDSTPPRATRATFIALLVTAIGTSIDAMAVGISLAFLDVNILTIALVIGATTMAMTATGTLAGHALGARFGKVIEIIGGVILIGIGTSILLDHLFLG
ncbi:manganese efflux pump MntP [Celeribacter sp. SCSIO 80788]|jgi:putative Mn2+ efflux pump MntP|uniref:manganese efflux pump MntP n=1 Tax=Celeribacter sp. SCSIO 80788 TaxID=3117013 RepID=UPI003DA5128A